jgi:hypothetical protein
MPADRLTFYLQRKQKVLQATFRSINTTTTTNWNHIAIRQASFKAELKVLEKLISINRQSVDSRVHQSGYLYPRQL